MSRSVNDILSLLPEFFAQHLLLSLTALAIGLAISLPAAVLASRFKSLQTPLMGFANAIQTIPSLALLALMVPLLGKIGFVPALLALVLYSMLPVLRNTITGLANVDPAYIEAADGLGMTNLQRLFRVELPLAAPTIVAGIRTATVWVVGIATLATPVGQTTLGNFIFTGLQTQNQTAVLIGCAAAAGLALLLDGVIRVLEIGIAKRSRQLKSIAVASLAAITLVGFYPMIQRAGDFGDSGRVVIGAKTFTEQHILAELLADRFRKQGVRVATKPGMGSQLLFDALAAGSVDCYVDYTGTIWTNVMQRQDFPSRRQMLVEMKRFLGSKYGIVSAGRLGFENTYALAMTRARAAELGVHSISDLKSKAPNLRLGGDIEFFGRPEWKRVSAVYDLDFADTRGLDASIMYSAVRDGEVDVVAAFSSDGRIHAYDLVVLSDDRQAFPPYDAVVLLSEKASRNAELVSALQSVVMSIDDDAMRLANKLVDVDGESPARAAEALWAGIQSGTTASAAPNNSPEATPPINRAQPVGAPPRPDEPVTPSSLAAPSPTPAVS